MLAATFNHADDLISQTRYDADGTPTTSFVQADGFGSTRWVTDVSGAITDSVDYSAFGETLGRTGLTDIKHLYRGEAHDPKLDFYYLRARWMDATLGRFVQADPWAGAVTDPGTLQKYRYAANDPINFSDPTGWSENILSLVLPDSEWDIRLT